MAGFHLENIFPQEGKGYLVLSLTLAVLPGTDWGLAEDGSMSSW